MKALKKVLYRSFVHLFNISPSYLKLFYISKLKKNSSLPQHRLRRDLKYYGGFKTHFSGSEFWIKNNGGPIEEEILWKGLFSTLEKDCGWIWVQLCEFSETIFDIGANIGLYSLIAQARNPQAQIFAFEPSRQTFETLQANCKLNRFHIQCLQLAISNSTEEDVVFYDFPDPHQTTASLSPEKVKNASGFSGEVDEYPVRTITLSDFIKEKKIKNVDLIKLDIELHEPEAIEGMGKYLEVFKPVIIMEVLTEQVAKKLNTLLPLEEYQIYRLRESQTAQPVEKFKIFDDTYSRHEWNFLMFHKSLEKKIRKKTNLFQKITSG